MKNSKVRIEHIYCLSTKDYTADYVDGCNDDNIHPYKGKCIMGIYKEDYEALKEAGFPCKEYTQVVLASTEYDNTKDSSKHTIRQAMFKHIVYADSVDHTNF